MKAIRNHDRYFALKDVAKNGFVLKYFANAFRETDGIGVTEAHDQVQNYGIKEEFDCNVVALCIQTSSALIVGVLLVYLRSSSGHRKPVNQCQARHAMRPPPSPSPKPIRSF